MSHKERIQLYQTHIWEQQTPALSVSQAERAGSYYKVLLRR